MNCASKAAEPVTASPWRRSGEAEGRIALLEQEYHEFHRRSKALQEELLWVAIGEHADTLRVSIADAERAKEQILMEVASIEDSLVG
jgi:hypothetical protein